MANFFEGVGNLLKHPIDEAKWMLDETKGVVKPLLKGDISESWDSFKGSFGRHNDMMEDITVPLGGRNKITENPDAAAGAIIGSIFAAPVIGGAMGGSSGASSGFGGFGTEGAFSKYFQPIGNKMGSMWDTIAGPSDDVLGNLADMEAGGAVDANLGMGDDALRKAGAGKNLQDIGQMLQSIKPVEQQQIQHSGGKAGGGFRFDQSQYKHQPSQKEFAQLYGAQPNTYS